MKGHWLRLVLFAGLSLTASACGGGDDDDSGGGGCAHAQMVCSNDKTVTIDCDQYDKAPSSIKDCVSKATTCDAVTSCLLGGT
jgi:hypothetical protein